MTRVTTFTDDYAAEFNEAVAAHDFSGLLTRFTDDAVLRFENVPPAGASLEFAGRPAFRSAETHGARQPDQPDGRHLRLAGSQLARRGQ